MIHGKLNNQHGAQNPCQHNRGKEIKEARRKSSREAQFLALEEYAMEYCLDDSEIQAELTSVGFLRMEA